VARFTIHSVKVSAEWRPHARECHAGNSERTHTDSPRDNKNAAYDGEIYRNYKCRHQLLSSAQCRYQHRIPFHNFRMLPFKRILSREHHRVGSNLRCVLFAVLPYQTEHDWNLNRFFSNKLALPVINIMRIKRYLPVIAELTIVIAFLVGLLFVAWPYRRHLLEIVGFNPASMLFTLAIAAAVLTVVAAWADAVTTRAPGQLIVTNVRTASIRHWMATCVFRLPIAIVMPLLVLNALFVTLELGLVRGKEIMLKPNQAGERKTTVFVGRTPLAEIGLRKTLYIQRDSDFAFIYPVPRLGLFRARADGLGYPFYARTRVFENGRLIGPAHALHDTIRKAGQGAYSHWSAGWTSYSALHFSATDNTSPITNGRVYSIDYVIELHPLISVLIVLLSLPMYVRGYIGVSGFLRKIPGASRWKWSRLSVCAIVGAGTGLFMLPLLAYWATGKTTNTLIGGLLPWSDGSGWLDGTYYFLNEKSLLSWTARRPISPAFMSLLAFVTGLDLRAMLVIRTLLTGLACTLVSAEIWRRLGAAPGISSYAVLVAYVSPFTPTTLTESLGLTFGATGFAMMWQAIARNQVLRFAGGLFLLSLANCVRPGPFLVFPIIVVWAALSIGRSHGSVIIRLFYMSMSVAAALIITFIGTYVFGTGESYLGANYAYTFYGLAFGGKPWSQFYTDFPQALSLPEPQQSAIAYRAAFAEIFHNPFNLLNGLGSFFANYFDYLFVYVEDPILRIISEMLAFCGVVVAGYWSRRDLHLSFLFWGAGGIVLSAPFLFWAEDAYRAFIPTAPFEAVIASVGLATILNLARCLFQSERRPQPLPRARKHGAVTTVMTTALAGLLVLGSTLAPVLALTLHTVPRFATTKCDGGLTPAVIHLGKSSPFIEIVADQGNVSHAPKITYRDFHADTSFANVEIGEALKEMKPGDLLIHGYDLTSGADTNTGEHTRSDPLHWLIATVSQMSKPGRYYLVCGQTKRLSNAPEWLDILFVETAREIAPLKD